jgi:hypothetical protein
MQAIKTKAKEYIQKHLLKAKEEPNEKGKELIQQ